MPEKIKDVKPPTGINRFLFRAPIWMYKLHLGGLLSGRFLLLNHIGRKSGQPRQVVLEVVGHDKARNIYFAASGFGKQSQWYKKILHTPEVSIQVGWKKWDVTAVALPLEQSGQKMVDYAHMHAKAAKNLMQFCGFKVDGSDEDYFIMGRDHIPFIAFEPRQ